MTTPRMALVPREATLPGMEAIFAAAINAAPASGKVSADKLKAARMAIQRSSLPYMPSTQRNEIALIVIAALGLEIEE